MSTVLLDEIVSHYLRSHEFNGCPASTLRQLTHDVELRAALESLCVAEQIEVLTPDTAENPAIKRLRIPPAQAQLQSIRSYANEHHIFVYPHPSVLSGRVNRSEYSGRPFSLLLALGAPHLDFRAFDMSVLEFYRNDPRYYYRCDGMHGFISIGDDHYQDDAFPDADKILLQVFGFAYNEHFERAVAAFLTDLSGLSPEHQQIWGAKQLPGDYRINPHFFQTQILGEFPDQIPIFTAFVMEMNLLNEMSVAMGRSPLFRKVPSHMSMPAKFGFLVRPTLQEFHDFVHLLDKLLSDNLNKDFFGGDIATERDVQRKDGKIVVEQRGTIQLLEEWCRLNFCADDMSPFEDCFKALKMIRKLRQQPAHALEDNRFDQKFFREQRELIIRAYTALRTLRRMFASHPAASRVEVMDLLYQGAICDY
ncbi:hypothetical protein WME94_08155 [Sorangium sp. So ce429]